MSYNTWLVLCPAYNENGPARHYDVNKNDKSQLKRNVEQINFQLALKTSKSLS